MTAGTLGISAVFLPSAASAASTGDASAQSDPQTTTTLASTESLFVHFDAGNSSSYSGSGSTWSDLGGSGNYGSISASISFVSASAGEPAHFNSGGSGSIDVKKPDGSLSLTDPSPIAYSKMIWFRRDIATSRFDNLFSSSAGSQAQHFLFFGGSTSNPYKRLTAGNNSSYNRLSTGLDVEAGVWTFAAVTFSTTTGFALYVNQNDRDWAGSGLTASSAYNSSTDALSGALGFQIGGYTGLHRLAGDIATALAYDRVLTTTEVRSYYSSTVGRFYPAG